MVLHILVFRPRKLKNQPFSATGLTVKNGKSVAIKGFLCKEREGRNAVKVWRLLLDGPSNSSGQTAKIKLKHQPFLFCHRSYSEKWQICGYKRISL